jgi:hypothetical protein
VHIVRLLLRHGQTGMMVDNRTGETALDTFEKMGHPEIGLILQEHGSSECEND